MPIIINEINNRPKYNIIKDAEKIYENVKKYVKENNVLYEEIIIDNGYDLESKHYDVKGLGSIFIDKSITFMFSRNNMCVMKLDYEDELMIQNEICPTYRMFNGIKEKIVTSGDGLYKGKNNYYFKGSTVNNIVLYNDIIWKIDYFDDDGVSLLNDNGDNIKLNKNYIVKSGTGVFKDPYIFED